MATTANSKLQITDLDFTEIKTNFIDYLKGQNTFQDYNFAGSALSTLLDVLTYNTQYNAYYLNMVANEMFLDSALQRSSVVSHAKLLNYVPRSAIAPTAKVQVVMSGIPNNVGSVTLPRYSKFLSGQIQGQTYNFVNTDLYTADVVNNVATFDDVTIREGTVINLNFNYDPSSNPKSVFELPQTNIDTTTLTVLVYPTSSSTEYEVYNLTKNYTQLDGTSKVYFMEENVKGFYEISFGDGILGKKLSNGNKVSVFYLVTNAAASEGANNFIMSTTVNNYLSTVTSVSGATGGMERETIDSIKYSAPKSLFSNRRAVSKEDYISVIQQNNIGLSFDAVNVWGGEENDPPVYGQVFISLKPTGAYDITETQKQKIIQEVIRPISVLTVEPTIVTPDYTFIQVNVNVYYNPNLTAFTEKEIAEKVKTAVRNFGNATLNTFNSTFTSSDLTAAIGQLDDSIITSEVSIRLQKKFNPDLNAPKTYKLFFGSPLNRGMFTSGVNSSPSMSYRDPVTPSLTIQGVFMEETPTSMGGIDSISIVNPGFGYQVAPTVKIEGDGTGATATATIDSNGRIKSINIISSGKDYTSAVVTITPDVSDTTGKLGAAYATVEGNTGDLKLYYYNNKGVKTTIKSIGTIDYASGVVTLADFNPVSIDNELNQLTITSTPTTSIVSSSYNRVISIDEFDPTAVVVNVITKK